VIRPLDNQEHINPPEGTDRITSLKRRAETGSRDFALNMKEAVREKEGGEEKKEKREKHEPQEDSVELSSLEEESGPPPAETPPPRKTGQDSVDIVI
jgi:hypothetical protein